MVTTTGSGTEPATTPTGRHSPAATRPDHYSVRLAGWQILSLNSEGPLDEQSTQQHWLRQALSGPGGCRIAFWHRPRFSAGSHGGQEGLDPL